MTDRPSAGDLIFMGPPGVGKGTQAQRLRDRHGWVQLSTGDLFRDHLRRATDLGTLARTYINAGSYVPDEVTVGMVREWIGALADDKRIMFDGFPRTAPQAEALDDLLAEHGRRIANVVVLEAPRDELVRRILGRARELGRADDSPELIGKRYDLYLAETEPVIAHYEARGLVRRVDGVGAIDEITERLFEASAA
ncbi:MAG TPA: adenylate kinase [Candidatus Saccharimonadales bacterium]|nr:adenylate kinase [Candidatus Saccharimonadales bacterium]